MAYVVKTYSNSQSPKKFIYTIMFENDADKLWSFLDQKDTMLVGIGNVHWNDDLTPWPSTKAFKKGEDFGGKADDFILFLENLTKEVEQGFDVEKRAFVGYSLGGLFALYLLFKSTKFSFICSGSGSLWYPGFADFVKTRPLKVTKPTIRLSLGDVECKSKNPVISNVYENTLSIVSSLEQKEADVSFSLVEGNHFTNPEKRMSDLIKKLYM